MSIKSGKSKIEWVSKYMPILNSIKEDAKKSRILSGLTIGVCLHIETKTGYLATVLKECGANVVLCGSNPLSTKDDIVEALRDYGVTVYSSSNMTENEYKKNIEMVAAHRMDVIIDDGADLVSYLLESGLYKDYNVIGSTEETTTGITRLKKLELNDSLPFPAIAVNDTPMKCMFDNRFGTAQSTLFSIFKLTNISLSGKTIVVAGYGWCGKGVASRAKAIGAKVIVCEVNSVKANEAVMDGFQVMKMDDAATYGDVFITVTGCKDVITEKHFKKMKNGAILANSGHFNNEINVEDLYSQSIEVKSVNEFVKTFNYEGKDISLLTDGRLVNLAGGDGHPIEIIDLSFSLQMLSVMYLIENKGKLSNKLYEVPIEIDNRVADLNLRVNGIEIDSLSPDQKEYLGLYE